MRVRLTVTACAKVPLVPFRVAGQGKPVQVRRGPATVTGDATRTSAAALEPLAADGGPGRRGAVGPEARRPAPTASPYRPRGKGVAPMLHRLAGLVLALLALLVPASIAAAAPVTVNLRIEGSTQTLFEGQVTSDAASLTTPSSLGAHPCNVGENTAPPSTTRAANPTTALAASGVSWDATWSESSFGNDFLISRIVPDASGAAFWAVFVNARLIDVGGCQFANAAGDAVLWAFDGFGKTPLALSGPTTATAGTPVTVTVRNAQTGAPVAGATV